MGNIQKKCKVLLKDAQNSFFPAQSVKREWRMLKILLKNSVKRQGLSLDFIDCDVLWWFVCVLYTYFCCVHQYNMLAFPHTCGDDPGFPAAPGMAFHLFPTPVGMIRNWSHC